MDNGKERSTDMTSGKGFVECEVVSAVSQKAEAL